MCDFRYPFPPAQVVQLFRDYFGPTQVAFSKLDAKGQTAMTTDLERLWNEQNQATDGTTLIPAEYLEVHRTILRDNWKPDFVKTRGWPERIASSAIVDSSAQLRGCTVIGRNCRVGAEASLEDTILWPDAEIASQSRLEACIVRSRKKVSGLHRDIDI